MSGERIIKRRAKREEFAIKQKALALAEPIGWEIGGWQARVTRLSLVVTRPQCPAEHRQAAAQALAEVGALVADRRQQLADLSAELPHKLATSSWFDDIRQGLESLHRRLILVEASVGAVTEQPGLPPPGPRQVLQAPVPHV